MNFTTDEKMPLSRTDNLVVQDLNDEALIYDLNNHKVYHLNSTMKLIWENCDGETLVQTITKDLDKKLKTRIEQDFIAFL